MYVKINVIIVRQEIEIRVIKLQKKTKKGCDWACYGIALSSRMKNGSDFFSIPFSTTLQRDL